MVHDDGLDARRIRVPDGPRWTRPLVCNGCGVAAGSGRVYAAGDPAGGDDFPGDGGRRGALSAFDAQSGKTIWSAGTAASFVAGSAPVLADGNVFVRTMGGGEGAREFWVEAFRASDGKHLWHASVGTATGYWFVQPAADATLVVYPSEDGFLYALDAHTGAMRWKTPNIDNAVKPAIVNGLVWAGDSGGGLVAFNAGDGRKPWNSPDRRRACRGAARETSERARGRRGIRTLLDYRRVECSPRVACLSRHNDHGTAR